jgi:putative phage-type endonuclease
MQTHHLTQGTPEWHAHRAQHFNASDAPAMLGCSPYKSRTQLLHEMHTGLRAAVDAGTQRRFDDGHRFEALARPLAEQIIGDDLAPVIGTAGKLSASFDGLTLMGDTAWEHKTLNDDLRACMRDPGNGYGLPKHYRVQMEQQLLVSGAERVLFMATRWEGAECVESRHCWYASDPALRAEIIAGWEQFAQDLASYRAPAAADVVTAAPIEALPAVSVQMQGALTVHSNLDVFGRMLREFIGRIPAKPSTEQEFADCDAACKALKRAEDALDGAEANALGQVQSVEQITRTIADLRSVARTARLASEKLVKARKEQIRAEEVQRGKDALAAHIAGLNATIGKPYMPAIAADFAGAISGKKTVDSVRNAIDTELARAKITASEIGNTILQNIGQLRELAAAHAFLFADTAQLVLKAPEDCRAVITSRIAEHKAAEERRLEAERERIRAEEAARLQREQEARDRETARQAAEAARAVQPPAAAPIAPPAPVTQAAAPVVIPMPSPAPAAGALLRLGQINERLAPLQISAEGLARLGFQPVAVDKAAKLFAAEQFGAMVDTLVAHLRTAAQKEAA